MNTSNGSDKDERISKIIGTSRLGVLSLKALLLFLVKSHAASGRDGGHEFPPSR
jgi:hypothetical protein